MKPGFVPEGAHSVTQLPCEDMSGKSRKKAEESAEGGKHNSTTSSEAEKRAPLEAKCDLKSQGRKTNQHKWSIESGGAVKASRPPATLELGSSASIAEAGTLRESDYSTFTLAICSEQVLVKLGTAPTQVRIILKLGNDREVTL